MDIAKRQRLTFLLYIFVGWSHAYNICVMDEMLASCLQMVSDTASLNLAFQCVRGRDRLDCMKKIQNGLADLAPFEPEDMYIAAKFMDDSLAVFMETRTGLAPLDMFRWVSVAVVRNDAQINYPGDLRGKVSCHPGYGRTVGWHVPIPRLTADQLIRPECQGSQPIVEHEIAAVAKFFDRACVPGKWTPDRYHDRLLKERYPNLCSACRDPRSCSDADQFAGNEGALKCIMSGVGHVAWTTYDTVRFMFGLNTGNPVAEANSFSFLCPDGGRRPITTPFPCAWSAKPWNGFLTRRTTSLVTIKDMQQKVTRAVDLARSGNGRFNDWLNRVLGFELDSVAFPFDELSLVTASEYLARSNYTLSIEGRGCRGRPIRFCVISDKEQMKCQDLRLAALSRRILPEIACVRGSSVPDCMERIRLGDADLRSFDGGEAYRGGRSYGLKPIVTEVYPGLGDAAYYSVAIIKANSGINRLEDLRDKKSCHTGFGRTSGWNIPVHALSEKQLITPHRCHFGRAMGQFFRQSCAPGAKELMNDVFRDNPDSLCSLCVGIDGTGTQGRCSSNPVLEMFSSSQGAFHCLVEGGGDVAFVDHITPLLNTDGNNLPSPWAAGLSSQQFRLLCKDGGVRSLQEFQNCNLGKVPAHKIMTDGWKSAEKTEEMRIVLMRLSDNFSPASGGQVVFRLFGPYDGIPHLLFKDETERLIDVGSVSYVDALNPDFVRMMERISCGAASVSAWSIFLMTVIAFWLANTAL